jgi:hypothetical protein
MSAEHRESVTASAIKFWRESLTSLSYTEYVLECKAKGLFWGCEETLEGAQ